jgi:hypothetical protein
MDRELTAEDENKLDRLLAILAEFDGLDRLMDLPMIRVLAAVCRYDGEEARELSPRLGDYALSVILRHALDLGNAEESFVATRRGEPGLGLMDVEKGPNRRIQLTPKGIEFRKRLLGLLGNASPAQAPRRPLAGSGCVY